MPLAELKVRARVRLNRSRREGDAEGRKLRHWLHEVAREAGFAHWEHARRVLSGEAAPHEDMGAFWHAPGCDALLNEWFTDAAAARAALKPGRYLLPFRRQFVVADGAYLDELGIGRADPAWREIGHDLVAGYGSSAWRVLARQRLKAPPSTFAGRRPPARLSRTRTS